MTDTVRETRGGVSERHQPMWISLAFIYLYILVLVSCTGPGNQLTGKFYKQEKAGECPIISHIHVRSKQECAMQCQRYPNCGSFAYEDDGDCRLSNGPMDDTVAGTKYLSDTFLQRSGWPAGEYGIIKSDHGCPLSLCEQWEEGGVVHYTETTGNANAWNVTHWPGILNMNSIEEQLCMKTRSLPGELPWQPGSYCIVQYGTSCPSGLQSKYITWDGDNGGPCDYVYGAEPRHEFPWQTGIKLFFCCRSDGSPLSPLILPTHVPFYLLENGAGCQDVAGMRTTLEYICYDTENGLNGSNGDETDMTISLDSTGYFCLQFCFYQEE